MTTTTTDTSKSPARPSPETLESFFQDLEHPSPSTNATASNISPQQTVRPAAEAQQAEEERLDISPRALYPRQMSCRQAFDQAFYCQSLGGKFNDIYRYGSLQSCSENWDQFWFCMRNRTLGGGAAEDGVGTSRGAKGERIAEYYSDREKRNKARWGSSEDVWEIRTEPVARAFWRDPDRVAQDGVRSGTGPDGDEAK